MTAITRKNIILTIILLVLLNTTISCQNKINEQKEMYAILTLLINNYAGKKTALTPPPPYPKDKFIVEKVSLKNGIEGKWVSKEDSLVYYKQFEKTLNEFKVRTKNKKYIIALTPYLFSNTKNVRLDSLFKKDYAPLMKRLNNLKENVLIDITKIVPIQGNTFIKSPTAQEEYRKNETWDNFDQVVNYSRISFNENYTKALVIIGVSRAKLDGYSALILLEKVNGKWVEVHNQLLNIS